MGRLSRYAVFVAWSAGVAAAAGVGGGAPAAGGAPASDDGRAAGAGGAAEFFEARVRPVLAEHCYRCHSAGAEKLKAGLLLDSRDGLLRDGENGPAVVPGRPDQSRLVEAIRYNNPDLQMPPKSRLPDRQVADLARWVEMGVPWPAGGPAGSGPAAGPTTAPADDLWRRREAHWAWQPVRPREPPAVRDATWPRVRADRFVLAKLEAAGLAPAGPADRRALVRRASFVLTGLPPAPSEVEGFVGDPSADAYERVVDRLLASPHFGERWARHWMDLVRYSDTLGNEADMPVPNAWRYRDYLVRAFNADVPYDQIIREHVAGDLLAEPRRDPATGANESVVGTGFYWMAEGKRSPVDLRAAQADAFDNRIDVMCKAFLGLTVACARCHDHKFDPIAQADYYALYGYLRSSRYTQAMPNKAAVDAGAEELAALQGKFRRMAGAALGERAGTLSRYMTAAAGQAGGGLDAGRVRRWAEATNEPAADPGHPMFAWRRVADLGPSATKDAVAARWREVEAAAEAYAKKAAPAPREGDVEVADFGRRGFDGWFVEDQAFGPAPLRPGDVLPGTTTTRPVATVVRGGSWAHSGRLSRRLQGTLRSPEFTIDRRYLHVLAAGRASRVNVVVDQFVTIQDPLYGQLRQILNTDGPKWLTYDLGMWKGRPAYVEFADTTTQDLHDMKPPDGCGPEGYVAVGRVVLSDKGAPVVAVPAATTVGLLGGGLLESLDDLAGRYERAAVDSLKAMADGTLADRPGAEARASLLSWLIDRGLLDLDEPPGDAPADSLAGLLKRSRDAEARLPDPVRAPAMTDGTPADEYVFVRGNPKMPGPVVPRRILRALGGGESPPATGSGRLDLARRMADPANPLTARVAVNRVWHHVFGRGIVASVDNFGEMGDPPTHPELLDDLADRFVRDGWSIKRLARELVLSSTFRMAAAAPPAAEAADPDNRLLHRMPVRRLEAEAVRDAILAVSGRLDRTVGGPPVEVHVTAFMDNYGNDYGKPKTNGPPDGDGRRSLYVKVRRNFLTPMLVAFDMPPPLNTAGRRTVSNVPAQALILMNDPFVAGQARLWAKRVLAEKGQDAAGRVRRMYLTAFARPPTDGELRTALDFLERQAGELGVPPGRRADDERAWAELAHVLLNVKEFIFLD